MAKTCKRCLHGVTLGLLKDLCCKAGDCMTANRHFNAVMSKRMSIKKFVKYADKTIKSKDGRTSFKSIKTVLKEEGVI
tara:strand:+ start:15994 stop:16227 length:234 start_codon:yes stop_codon:yes gene_type:complete